MIVRTLTVALCCCFLAGCGGGGDDTNAATARSFNYGPPEITTPPQAAGDAFSSLTAFQSTGDEASAVAAHGSLMAVGFEALGDDLGIGGFAARTDAASALVREARSLGFGAALGAGTAATQLPAQCTTVERGADGATTVTFANCQYSETTTTETMTVRIAGRIAGSPGKIDWDVSYQIDFSGADATIAFGYHDVGRVDVVGNAVKAHQEADVGATLSADGQRAQLGFAQSVDLDVIVADSCATNVVGGTLEAKRVWTQRPSGASSAELPDRGVLFTWTDCGTGTVQFSR